MNDFFCRYLNGFFLAVYEYSKYQTDGQFDNVKHIKTATNVSDDNSAGKLTKSGNSQLFFTAVLFHCGEQTLAE